MTSRYGDVAPPLNRLPIGFSPGQYRCASASLTTATLAPLATSCSVNGRPRTIGIPRTSKYPGDTVLKLTIAGSPPPDCDCVTNPVAAKLEPSGSVRAAATPFTPGSACSRVESACWNALAWAES